MKTLRHQNCFCAAPYTQHWPICHSLLYLQVGQELWTPSSPISLSLTLSFTHCTLWYLLPLLASLLLLVSLKTQCVSVCVCVCMSVWMSLECLPNRQKMFPGPCLPPLPAGQLCCLRLWAGLELYQTGNLRVALVIQASPCLIPHKQTPTPPPKPPPPTPPSHPLLFSAHNSAPHPLLSLAWQLLTHHTSSSG